MSLFISGARVFINGSLQEKNIFVDNGTIAKITTDTLQADRTIDATGLIVIPGAIDPHVHFREPGLTHKEDLLSGSMACAAGGITSFLDMPNTIPPTTTCERLAEKKKLAHKCVVHWGFHFGTAADNGAEIDAVTDVPGVKVYMDVTTGELMVQGDAVLKSVFSHDIAYSVHAENEHVTQALTLTKGSTKPLYLCHCSSASELDQAKNQSIRPNVYVEVTPHHLFLNEEDAAQMKGFGEMKPFLKTKADCDALWEGIRLKKVDTIGTDHAPHTVEEKRGTPAPFGVPGVETMLPLMLNAVHDGRLELKDVVRLCCENAAKIFKMKNKGKIEVGYDGDLTIIDMNMKKTVTGADMFSKSKWTPFEGWELQGWPVYTVVSGSVVFEKGQINKIPASPIEFTS